jgi:integrase
VRVTAVCRLRVGDFEDARQAWLKLDEKGGKERRIACHHVTREYLQACMVKRRCKPAGPPSFISNHSFRATCATIALENGARLEDVQELLGHADPGTTQTYNRTSREQSRSTVEYVQVF